MALSFTFGNVDISALPGIELLVRDVNGYPSRRLNIHKLARADKSVTTSAEFESKSIILTGNLKGDNGSRQDAEQKWAVIKGYLNQREQELIISQYGQDIIYIATVARMADSFLGGYLEWRIEFTCADPVGRETSSSVLLASTNITTATSNKNVSVGGSHYASPIITVELNSGTGLSDKAITIKNAETGQGITINRTWVAGETLTIDCLEKLVSVDGAFVEYSGSFPNFFPGSRVIGYIDTFTTRSVNLAATYVRRYV